MKKSRLFFSLSPLLMIGGDDGSCSALYEGWSVTELYCTFVASSLTVCCGVMPVSFTEDNCLCATPSKYVLPPPSAIT